MIGGFLTYDSLKVFGGVTICRDPSWPCLYFLIFNQITSLSPSLSSAVSLSCIKRSVYLFGRGQGWTLCMCRARQTEACASLCFHTKSGNAERVAQRCGCVYLCFGIQLPWNNQTISVWFLWFTDLFLLPPAPPSLYSPSDSPSHHCSLAFSLHCWAGEEGLTLSCVSTNLHNTPLKLNTVKSYYCFYAALMT